MSKAGIDAQDRCYACGGEVAHARIFYLPDGTEVYCHPHDYTPRFESLSCEVYLLHHSEVLTRPPGEYQPDSFIDRSPGVPAEVPRWRDKLAAWIKSWAVIREASLEEEGNETR